MLVVLADLCSRVAGRGSTCRWARSPRSSARLTCCWRCAPTGAADGDDRVPRLRAQDVAAHRGSRQVLHGVSLAVDAGEAVALVGPNAAGKSTLLRVLAGLMRPSAGSVFLDERPLATPGARRDGARHGARVSRRGRLRRVDRARPCGPGPLSVSRPAAAPGAGGPAGRRACAGARRHRAPRRAPPGDALRRRAAALGAGAGAGAGAARAAARRTGGTSRRRPRAAAVRGPRPDPRLRCRGAGRDPRPGTRRRLGRTRAAARRRHACRQRHAARGADERSVRARLRRGRAPRGGASGAHYRFELRQ